MMSFCLFVYLFLAALGLCCFARAFFNCGERGLLSSCGRMASHFGGFSRCGTQALAACGLRSFNVWALEHRLSSCGMGG